MSILGPAILAGTWPLSGMAAWFQGHPWLVLVNLPGLGVAVIATLGKLEKAPFDIPEAETELAGGTFTEYSGKLLALFRMTIDVEAVVTAALLAAVFLPWGLSLPWWGALPLQGLKILVVLLLLTLARTIFTRMRLDQMVLFCWRWVAPAALLQLLVDVVVAGGLEP
jgi:NADH-quinone oxidoreductase subunit H